MTSLSVAFRLVMCVAAIAAMAFADGSPRRVEDATIAMRRVTRPPAFTPAKLEIPSIGLFAAPVVPVLTRADGKMDSPKTAEDVGWYAGVKAGAGNALFAGHHDWEGSQGSFYNLNKIAEGDTVIVRGQGKTLEFKVTWKDQVKGDIDAREILADKGLPIVTLITCAGYFDPVTRHHQDRIVVRGVLEA